jgi:hypothetical protein
MGMGMEMRMEMGMTGEEGWRLLLQPATEAP